MMIVIAEAVCRYQFGHLTQQYICDGAHRFCTCAKHGTSNICHLLVFNLVLSLVLDQEFGKARSRRAFYLI